MISTVGPTRGSVSRGWCLIYNLGPRNRLHMGPACVGGMVAVGSETHNNPRHVVYLCGIPRPARLYR